MKNQPSSFTTTPMFKGLSLRRGTTVSILDIGTNKVVCLIAELTPSLSGELPKNFTHTTQLIGIGHQTSSGLKGGMIVDHEAAEYAILHAVAAAERMAGVEIQSALVTVNGGRIGSSYNEASVPLEGVISQDDVDRVLQQTCLNQGKASRSLIHSLPLTYCLDQHNKINNPIGMLGKKLSSRIHFVSADTSMTRNFEFALQKCQIEIRSFVSSSYASALSTLTEEEMEIGCVLVDIGAGTTNISVFEEGNFIFADSLAMGGNHISMDIARGLTIRFSAAERLKITHGSTNPSLRNERSFVMIPREQELSSNTPSFGPKHIQKGHLVQIIQPRVAEIIEFVRDRLVLAGFQRHMKQRLVLTGGSSLLHYLPQFTQTVTQSQVRLGFPPVMKGLPSAARTPAFAASIGTLLYPQYAHMEYYTQPSFRHHAATGTDNYFIKLGRWFKDSF